MADEPQAPKHHGRRVPKPDSDAHNAAVAATNGRIEELRGRLNQIRETLGGTDRIKGKHDGKRSELRSQLAEVRRQQNALRDSRNGIMEQLKDVGNTIKKKTDEIRSVRDKLQFKSLSEIDRQIKQLEQQLESGNILLIEEKRIINEISNLKKSRKIVENFAGQQETLDSEKKTADALRTQLDALDPQRKALEASFTEIQGQLNELDKEKDTDFAKLNDIYAERSRIQEEIQAEFNKRKELQDGFRKQKEDYFKFLQEERERRAEEARLRKQQYDEERLRNEIAKVEEMVQVPAFQDELNIVSNLITFFTQLQGDQKPAAEAVVNGSAAAAAPAAAPEKMVALKSKSSRLDEDAFFMGKSSKGKAATSAATPKKGGKPKALKLDLSILEALDKIKVDVPVSQDDIAYTIQALEGKKQHYIDNQDAETQRIKTLTEEKVAALKAKLGKMSVQASEEETAAPAETTSEVVVAEADVATDDA
ncbi:hypothetical protein DFJ74DRAFT_685320 [Hyaloraphidium curvatum]|nr:hypothetical protein DFJ74DRAFT_685320 [Hyaloraphidium curvatum]